MQKKRLFNTIYIYSLISIVVVVFFSLVSNFYYIRLLQQQTIKRYQENLAMLSESIDTSLDEMLQTTTLLSTNPNLLNILYHPGPLSVEDHVFVARSMPLLARFRASNSLIHAAYIVLENSNLIFSSDGSGTIEEFMSLNERYSCNSYDFRMELAGTNRRNIILPPCSVGNAEGGALKILPFIQFQNEDRSFFNPLVIDIDLEKIESRLKRYTLTENSHLYIYDREHQYTLHSGGELSSPDLAALIDAEASGFSRIEDGRFLTIKFSDPNGFFADWEYIAMVPYGDFIFPFLQSTMIPIAIVLFSLIVASILSYKLSGRIYSPIGELILKVKEMHSSDDRRPGERDDLEYLNSEFFRIIDVNRKLNRELVQAIPYVCERYLLSVLNFSDLTSEQDINDFLRDHGFTFDRGFFSAIITAIDFSRSFYESFSREDHDTVYRGILAASRDISDPEIRAYALSIGPDRICTIFNMDHHIQYTRIVELIRSLYDRLDFDREMIHLHSSIGMIYPKLAGLHRSYQEARKSLGKLHSGTDDAVRIYSSEMHQERYFYPLEKENILYNHLIRGDRSAVNELVAAVIQENINRGISEEGLKELYFQIYNTGKRVLNLNGLGDYDLLGDDYLNLHMSLKTAESGKIHAYLTLFLNRILDMKERNTGKYNLDGLKQYLDDHYKDDIFLDQIGDAFNITAKYASKLIKRELGIPFYQYISRLRITRAKELLRSTDMRVNEIAKAIGFHRRHPYLRMFKQYEGITPTEYRKGSGKKPSLPEESDEGAMHNYFAYDSG